MALLVVLVVVMVVTLLVMVTLGEEVVAVFATFDRFCLGFARLTGLVLIKVFAGPKEPENEMK